MDPKGKEIQTYLDRLGNRLESLYMLQMKLLRVDLSALTALKVCAADDNRKLKKIVSFPQSSSLERLQLSDSRALAQLPSLDKLLQLTKLDLSCTGIRELPDEICRMKNLRMLDMSVLRLRDLPDWLPDIAERFSFTEFDLTDGEEKAHVVLYLTGVETILDMSIFDQPYERVVKYFEERHTLNEITVVFLGDDEAGKSHIFARLMNDGGDPVNYVDFSTPGIMIRDKEYDQGDRKFTIHYWDTDGHELMHSMHRYFLAGRTMYVVLISALDDTRGDRAEYWLHHVKSFDPDAPALLVLNQIDQNENASVDEVDLCSRYEKLTRVVRLSARDFSPKDFNEQFTEVLLEEIRNNGCLDAQ